MLLAGFEGWFLGGVHVGFDGGHVAAWDDALRGIDTVGGSVRTRNRLNKHDRSHNSIPTRHLLIGQLIVAQQLDGNVVAQQLLLLMLALRQLQMLLVIGGLLMMMAAHRMAVRLLRVQHIGSLLLVQSILQFENTLIDRSQLGLALLQSLALQMQSGVLLE